MSYSYECNVICDGCNEEVVSGEPCESSWASRDSAMKMAEANGWFHGLDEWLCSTCRQTKPDKMKFSQ